MFRVMNTMRERRSAVRSALLALDGARMLPFSPQFLTGVLNEIGNGVDRLWSIRGVHAIQVACRQMAGAAFGADRLRDEVSGRCVGVPAYR